MGDEQHAGDEVGRRRPGAVLGGSSLFADLPDAIRRDLEAEAQRVQLSAGRWLFRQGEPGDACYVVASGRLEAVAEGPGPPVVKRLLSRGDALGELALLSGARRSTSVRAIRDSELLRLDRDRFSALLTNNAEFAAALARSLATKLRVSAEADAPSPSRPHLFAVVAAEPDIDAREFIDQLIRAIRLRDKLTLIDRDDARLTGDPSAWGRRIDQAEREGDTVVLVSAPPGEDQAWTDFCARQADRVLVLVASPTPRPLAGTDLHSSFDLVLMDAACAPHAVRAWLRQLRPRAHHLVRRGAAFERDVARVARRVTQRSIGVVLSGGGARGFAHIGVLDTLIGAGIDVDRLGGTSMGAFVAALYAVGMPVDEVHHICRTEFVEHRPFRDFTVPRVSLIRANKARLMLSRVFNTRQLEDLVLECFCVSADLASAEVVVHRRGPIVDAVGASMSLPGLAPPVRSEGRLLVDGGVLNNLPVDVMAATNEGPVVAVDVVARAPLGAGNRLPSIVETLARATVLGSRHDARARLASADVVISPDVDHVGLLDFAKFDSIVAAGRRAAEEALASGRLGSL